MELIYLWIDSYKNIENQGFNFSPSYFFEMKLQNNGNYKLIYNFSNTERNKTIIKLDFFGKNISNINAIIGKNGSGKSNLLLNIFDNFQSNDIKYNLRNTNVVAIIKDKEKLEIYYNDESKNNFSGINGAKVHKYNKNNSQTLSYLKKQLRTLYYTSIFQEKSPFSLNSYNNLSLYKDYRKNKTQTEITNNNIKFIGYFNNRGFTCKEICVPKTVTISPKTKYDFLQRKIDNINSIELNLIESVKNILKNEYNPSIALHNFENEIGAISSIEMLSILLDKIIEKIEDIYKKNGNDLIYDMKDIYNFDKHPTYDSSEKQSVERVLYNYLTNVKLFIEKYFKYIRGTHNLDDENLIKAIELYNYTFIPSSNISNPEKDKNEWLEFKYEPELSTGEEHMLSMYGRFYEYFKKIHTKDNYIILLDEPDIFMHPEWQRRFIKSISTFFNEVLEFKNEPKFHIIISSHSPFIASDLPKENVIMLDKSEEGKCKVVKTPIKTFGANIFNLYSEAFFLDSTFGEFAKNKIREVVELFETKRDKTNKKTIYIKGEEIVKRKLEIEYIINSIGEPLIKKKLENIYNEYKYLTEKKKDLYNMIKNANLSAEELGKMIEQIKNK